MHDNLWIAKTPLMLASASSTRRDLLVAAGIPVAVCPAQIDERLIDFDARTNGAPPLWIATLLARAKAIDVSARNPGQVVLGADQTLECDGRQFDKPSGTEEGRAHLKFLSGRTHLLHSAAVLVKDGQVLAESVSSAQMTMRRLSETFISAYVERVGPRVIASVGGYQLEALGSQLFDSIVGDHFTILGLPLLPLMGQLRELGYLAE